MPEFSLPLPPQDVVGDSQSFLRLGDLLAEPFRINRVALRRLQIRQIIEATATGKWASAPV